MFQESFWCVEVQTSVPHIKWSVCSRVLLFNVWRGRGFGLISIRLLRLRYCVLLFYLQFCVRLFPLFIRSLRKLDGNRVRWVILVAVGTAPPWGVRPVRVIVLVVWFSRVYTGVAIFVVDGVHCVTIYTIHRAGCYGYRCYCCIVKPFHNLFIYVTTNSYGRYYRFP